VNLSKREKLLAAGVGLIFFLFLGNYIWESIRSGIDTKENLKLNLSKQRDEQKLQLTAGASGQPVLAEQRREGSGTVSRMANQFGRSMQFDRSAPEVDGRHD
jgi:hypothetical protein